MKKRGFCIFICTLMIVSTILSVSATKVSEKKSQSLKLEPFTTGKTWMKTLGGKEYDIGRCIQQTSDEGYIVVGSTENFGIGGTDVWVLKTDRNGDELWNKTFGTDNPEAFECGTSVVQTCDNGYMITARVAFDCWLIKIDENGNEVWVNTYERREAYSMCLTDDECVVITGSNFTVGGLWILKVDTSGNEIWDKNHEKINSDGRSIKQTSDHGFIIAGVSCILKTDEFGEEQWNITLNDNMKCWDVLQSTDGKYAAIGSKGVWTKNDTGWFMSIDTNGTILFLRKYGGIFTGYIFKKIHQTSEGNYIITGDCNREIEPWGMLRLKLCLLKINKQGFLLWRRIYGLGTDYDFGVDAEVTSDGGFIILGGTNTYGAGNVDIWLIKTNSNGRVNILYRFLNFLTILKVIS